MSWLSDRYKEAQAQLNPFDGGKTASTVRADRKVAQPAQTKPRSTVSKVWDQVNTFDNGRTYKQATPTSNRSVVGQFADSQIRGAKTIPSTAKSIVDPFLKLGKVGIEYNRAALAKGSGNTNAYNAARTRLDQNLDGAYILGGANRIVKNAVGSISGRNQDVLDQKLAESIAQNQITANNTLRKTNTPQRVISNYKNSNQGDLSAIDLGARQRGRSASNVAGVTAVAETGLDVGSLGLGSLGKGVLKPTASRLLSTGVQGGVGSVASSYGQDVNFDIKNPGQVGKTFATGVGTGIIAGEGTRLLNNGLSKVDTTPRAVDPNKPTYKDITNIMRYKQERGGFVDDAVHSERLNSLRKFGIDPTKPESWTQIDSVLSAQGGYIKNPLANDAPQVGKTPKYTSIDEMNADLVQKKASGDPDTISALSDISAKAQKLIDGGMSQSSATKRVFQDYYNTANLEPSKYATLDDFIKAQGTPLYHGTDAKFDRFTLGNFGKTDEGFSGKGVYLSARKGNAKQYGKNIVESYVNLKNPLVYEDSYSFGAFSPARLRERLGLSPNASAEAVTTELKRRGHDGLVIHEQTGKGLRKSEEVVVLDPDQILTKPQLEELYNQSKPTPVAQVGKTPKTVETPVSPPAPKASNDLNAQRVFKNKETVLETIRQDKAVTKAAVDAQRTGQEVNFVATYDQNGRSVGVKPYEPSSMSIESGFVVNQQGQVIGTHIKVDDTGISANVGGEIVNMTDVVGNPSQWGNSYEVSSTMDRNLQKNAPDDATYRKTRSFVIDNKTKNEANLKTELKAKRQELSTRVADIQSVKPKNVSDTEFKSDIFDAIEGKMDDVELGKRYSPEVVAKINDYKAQTRQVYDELLDRVNTVFRQYGQPEVPHRADYLTHINELNNKPNFAGEMFGELQNSLLGEGMTRTRGQVPGNIAGRTENFEPTRKWNKFFQQRKGGKFDKDPFKAVDTYLEPTLYNIHMTESAVRARAIEATFRAVDEIKQMDSKAFSDTLNESLEQFRGGNSPKLISGFQEYANALAGKTQRWDRQVIDSSRAGELGLKGWQGLQRIGGRATVLGNANSVLSQALGTPMALAQAGPKNYIKGIVRAVKGDKIIDQSPFITARRTNSDSIFKTKFDKTMDVGGVLLQKMELAFVENTWHGMHEKALSQGYTGRQAILEADRLTERVVAGRGIADKPEAYRSTISNGFLQYTLEVNAQNKAFWRDLDTKQKATFIVSAYLMNEAYGFVTGNEPLPDFLGATIDNIQDFRDKEDKRNTKDKLIGSGRRYVGEVAEMNPFVQAGANTVLTQDQRKKVFGEDSSLGRYDGVAAPVQVVRNTTSAVGNLLEGDFKGARNDALRVTPFGNQARKTVTGAETISKGYAVDSSGNPTFSAPTSFAGKAQTLIFGPSSSKRAGSYYDNDQRSLSKDQAEQLRDLPKEKQAGFLESIQNKRMDNRKKEKDGTSTSVLTPTLQDIKDNQEAKTENFKSQFSDDDYELLGNEDMRKEAIAKGIKTQEELDGLDRYALNKRKELGMPAGQLGAKEVPDKIDKTDDKVKSFYTDRSYVHQDDYETWQSKAPESDSAKDMIRRVSQLRPEGMPDVPQTNKVAELYADFVKTRTSSKWTPTIENNEKKKLLRQVYGTTVSEEDKTFIKQSDTIIRNALVSGELDQETMNRLVQYDDMMAKLGGSPEIGKTLRRDYGYGIAPSGSTSSGSSRKSASGYVSPYTGSNSIATRKQLRNLLFRYA